MKTPQTILQLHDLSVYLQEHIESPFAPVRSDSYTIIYFQRGKGTYWIDLREYELADNIVFCLHAGQLSVFKEIHYAEGYIITFTADMVCHLGDEVNILTNSGLFNAFMVNPVSLTEKAAEDLPQIICSLFREYYGANELRVEVMRSMMRVIIILLSRSYQFYDNSALNVERDVQLVNNFLDLVQKHFMQKRRVAEYATELLIAPNYLNVKVKRVSGFTASYHIHQRILLEAKRQARWEGMNLKQIAYTLGFDDIAHFSKFFKRTAGVSFSEFKRGNCIV